MGCALTVAAMAPAGGGGGSSFGGAPCGAAPAGGFCVSCGSTGVGPCCANTHEPAATLKPATSNSQGRNDRRIRASLLLRIRRAGTGADGGGPRLGGEL